jgi:hypothetical protein
MLVLALDQFKGAYYDPCQGLWTPLAEISVPSSKRPYWDATVDRLSAGAALFWRPGGANQPDLNPSLGVILELDPAVAAPWMSMAQMGASEGGYEVVASGTLMTFGSTADLEDFSVGRAYAINGWRTLPASPLEPRKGFEIGVIDGQVAVWGGYQTVSGNLTTGVFPDQKVLGDGAILNPLTNTWTKLSDMGAPSARVYAATGLGGGKWFVWGGTTRVSWGGYAAMSQNDGGLYDPAANAWKPVSTAGAPSARSHAKVVWSGSTFAVWGGRGDADTKDLSDGFLYDPTNDTWSEMNAASRPENLFFYNSYVMADGNLFFFDAHNRQGAILDVAHNRWSTLDLAGGPPDRGGQIVLWTGSRLMVWGGGESMVTGPDLVQSRYFNDGAIFTPHL